METGNDKKDLKQIGVFLTIPFVLALPPIIGWFIGSWIDEKLDSAPWFMFVFIALGFASGIRELFRLIRRFGDDN